MDKFKMTSLLDELLNGHNPSILLEADDDINTDTNDDSKDNTSSTKDDTSDKDTSDDADDASNTDTGDDADDSSPTDDDTDAGGDDSDFDQSSDSDQSSTSGSSDSEKRLIYVDTFDEYKSSYSSFKRLSSNLNSKYSSSDTFGSMIGLLVKRIDDSYGLITDLLKSNKISTLPIEDLSDLRKLYEEDILGIQKIIKSLTRKITKLNN